MPFLTFAVWTALWSLGSAGSGPLPVEEGPGGPYGAMSIMELIRLLPPPQGYQASLDTAENYAILKTIQQRSILLLAQNGGSAALEELSALVQLPSDLGRFSYFPMSRPPREDAEESDGSSTVSLEENSADDLWCDDEFVWSTSESGGEGQEADEDELISPMEGREEEEELSDELSDRTPSPPPHWAYRPLEITEASVADYTALLMLPYVADLHGILLSLVLYAAKIKIPVSLAQGLASVLDLLERACQVRVIAEIAIVSGQLLPGNEQRLTSTAEEVKLQYERTLELIITGLIALPAGETMPPPLADLVAELAVALLDLCPLRDILEGPGRKTFWVTIDRILSGTWSVVGAARLNRFGNMIGLLLGLLPVGAFRRHLGRNARNLPFKMGRMKDDASIKNVTGWATIAILDFKTSCLFPSAVQLLALALSAKEINRVDGETRRLLRMLIYLGHHLAALREGEGWSESTRFGVGAQVFAYVPLGCAKWLEQNYLVRLPRDDTE